MVTNTLFSEAERAAAVDDYVAAGGRVAKPKRRKSAADAPKPVAVPAAEAPGLPGFEVGPGPDDDIEAAELADYPALDFDRHEVEYCGVCGAIQLAAGQQSGLDLPPVVAASRLSPHRGGYRWVPLCGGCWDGVAGADTVVTGDDDG